LFKGEKEARMETRDITIGMAGSGGDGVVSAGDILAASAAAEGINCLMLKSFGPQIRGGESSCRLRLSTGPVYSQGDRLDVLVVFNWTNFARFTSELPVHDGTYVLVDENDKTEKIPLENINKCEVIRIPFEKLASEDAGNPKAKNMVTLGVLAEMFHIPSDGIKRAIERKFSKKGAEVVAANHKAIDVGINYVKKNCAPSKIQFVSKPQKAFMALTGNEAVAFGAVAAGCRFFSSYPITPATEIMEWLSRELPKFDGTVLQAEDEISAINAVIGASFGGVKAMTSTSGPGLSLKLEAIGLASMAELPIVVIDVQRGGPSTGMPTKTEQADLMQAIFGMHGDAPHAVLAPCDVEDCFEVGWRAFEIAEKYQMPVIILSDQFMGQRKETVVPFDISKVKVEGRTSPKIKEGNVYRRYEDTDTGVSPATWPGIKGGEYLASGIEHTEEGFPSSQYETHERMSAKRAKKIDTLAVSYKFIRRYGPEKAKVGVLAWGSTKGAVREAVERLNRDGFAAAALVPQIIYPLQKDEIRKFARACQHVLVVEMSYSGQFEQYLSGSGVLPQEVLHYRSSGGRVFTSEEIISAIKAAAEGRLFVPKEFAKPSRLEGKDEE
jgi:2-oxoglutarate ferredoxin oxidoreductase subunit alpha